GRISHTRCRLRRFKKPTGQKPRAVRSGGSDKRGDAPCWPLQPALRVAFRRASPASGGSTVCPDTLFPAPRPILPRRKSNAGDMECEKCGLGRAISDSRRRYERHEGRSEVTVGVTREGQGAARLVEEARARPGRDAADLGRRDPGGGGRG